MILFLIFLFFQISYMKNLIKYGDFQYYANRRFNYLVDQNAQYYSQPSDINSWYDKALGPVEVKQIFNVTTFAVDLSSTIPMTLCQDVILQVGKNYKLSYDAYSTKNNRNMSIKAYLNSQLLATLYITNSSSFGNRIYSFNAYKSLNQICFNETHTAAPPYSYSLSGGGLIDNISITLAEAYIYFQSYIIEEFMQTLFILSNYSYSEELKDIMLSQYDILINNQVANYSINSSNTGYLKLQIFVELDFRLDSIRFVQKQNFVRTNTTQVYILISPPPLKYFCYLDKNEIQMLVNAKNILIFISRINSKIINFFKIFFFAYLINLIIDAQFLSLLYIFTQLNTIPNFTKKIYHQVLSVLFLSEGFIDYFKGMFKITAQFPQIHFQDQFIEEIDIQKNKQHWFGYYGFTSRVIKGNTDNIFILILCLFKIFCMKILQKIFSHFFPKLLRQKIQLSSFFLIQFCYITPFILIPLSANISYGVQRFSSKSYKFFCILLLFSCLICICFQMFSKSLVKKQIEKKVRKKSNQNKLKKEKQISCKKDILKIIKAQEGDEKKEVEAKPKKTIQKIKLFKKYQHQNIFLQQAFNMPLLFFIPVMMFLVNAKIFLIFNSLTVCIRFFNFVKNSFKTEMVDFFIGVVWVVHHCVFVVFLILSEKQLDSNQIQMVTNLGITGVITIICILLLQSFKMAKNTIIIIKKFIRILIQLIKQRNRRKQEKQTKKSIVENNEVIFINVVEILQRDRIQEEDKRQKKQKYKKSSIKQIRNQRF